MPFTQIESIAKPLGLHPRILHHCRLHLEYHRDDPFFGQWHVLAAAGNIEGIDRHYRPLFTEAEAALAALRAKNPARMRLTIRVWSRPGRHCTTRRDFWPSRPSPSLRSMPRRLRSTTAWRKRRASSRASRGCSRRDGRRRRNGAYRVADSHPRQSSEPWRARGPRFSGGHAGLKCAAYLAGQSERPTGTCPVDGQRPASAHGTRLRESRVAVALRRGPRGLDRKLRQPRRCCRRIQNCWTGWPAISWKAAGPRKRCIA